jgi:hypothetical protein
LVILLLLLAAGGCAAGREHSYETISPRIMNGPKGAGLVVITVHDERTEVRSGAEDPDFVGLSRGGYGNPFDVSTKSGAPLANDLATAIERGMNQARYHVRVVWVAHDKDPAQVVANLSRDGARALLLLRLHNLKSDTYTSTALHYQLEGTHSPDRTPVKSGAGRAAWMCSRGSASSAWQGQASGGKAAAG